MASRDKADMAGLKTLFSAIVGEDNVRDDAETRALHSEDVWEVADHTALLVVAPASLDDLSAVMAAAHKAGLSVAPRGAGMSYTASYLPVDDRTLSLDLRRMNRVLNVSEEDMTVTVAAGCTWFALHQALAPRGLRTPFWGPLSGLYSTIGGGLSQQNAMFGAAHHGTTSESMIALTVVLADGTLLRTGARGTDGNTPFYRHYGPDLAGLFCGDCGTLGVKAEITLRLIRAPLHEDYASFSFESGKAQMLALAEIARSGVAAEIAGFDPALARIRMRGGSVKEEMKTLGSLIRGQKSLLRGLWSAAQIIAAGRDFMPEGGYTLHMTFEGRSRQGVADDHALARAIAARFGGTEIPGSIARVIRSVPFPPPYAMLGPNGESWVGVHGTVALSKAPALLKEFSELLNGMRAELDAHRIETGFLSTVMSTNAISIEPVFFWPNGYRPMHASVLDRDFLSRVPKLPPNPEATAIVARAMEAVRAICLRFGCAHFQIGRVYPYRESRDAASLALLDNVKNHLDPNGKLNPGSLGFRA